MMDNPGLSISNQDAFAAILLPVSKRLNDLLSTGTGQWALLH